MSEVQGGGSQGKGGAPRWILVLAGVAVVAGVLYGAWSLGFKSRHEEGLKPLATGAMAKLVVPAQPGAPAQITATDSNGKPVSLADFKGQVVVVNLWATWCAPCVKEMPTLAELQGQYASKPVKVLAISLDKGDSDIAKARAFIADKRPLAFYHGDYDLAFSINPPAEGLPTTILYDRSGRERARLSGGADWSTPEAKKLLERLLALKG